MYPVAELLLGSAMSKTHINCYKTLKCYAIESRQNISRLPSFQIDEAHHGQLETSWEVQALILGHCEPWEKHHVSSQFFHLVSHNSIAHLEEQMEQEMLKWTLEICIGI
jgi:hypothetical protein